MTGRKMGRASSEQGVKMKERLAQELLSDLDPQQVALRVPRAHPSSCRGSRPLNRGPRGYLRLKNPGAVGQEAHQVSVALRGGVQRFAGLEHGCRPPAEHPPVSFIPDIATPRIRLAKSSCLHFTPHGPMDKFKKWGA